MAKQAGISLKGALLDGAFNEAAYQRVFTSMEKDRADALMVSEEVEHITNRAARPRKVGFPQFILAANMSKLAD